MYCRCLSSGSQFNFSSKSMNEIRKRIKTELKNENIMIQGKSVIDGLKRRISNTDKQTCWLNACLQMILCGIDYSSNVEFNSLLGRELQNLQCEQFINPTRLKLLFQEEIDRNSYRLERENLLFGQQDARDFLINITENKENWLDVYHTFHHVTVQTLACRNCKTESYYRSSSIFHEMTCPPDNSRLRNYIEQIFSCSEEVEYTCEKCQKTGLFKKSLKICSDESSEFMIFVLTRGIMDSINNYNNRIIVTDNCIIEDHEYNQHTYEPIAVIEHEGTFTSSTNTEGHYVCDVKHIQDREWYNTDDESIPKCIPLNQVTKYGYIILYRKFRQK